jgi:hypothetical protein
MIKIEAQNAFFKSQTRQAELAACLDEAFDVTYGSYGQGQPFWLCDPKPQVSERFGFSQEIVALYSSHPKPDARLLTSLSSLLNQKELRARVDRIVSLIIYEGDPATIKALTEREHDRILVPIAASELIDKQRGPFFIRAKIAERVGQFDLFGMSSPIQHDRYFYGRQNLVQELLTRAVARREQSGLFGLRKTGKTSVLFAVQRRLEETETLCEYMDCQNPGIYGGRWWNVVDELTRRILKSANQRVGGTTLKFTESASPNAAVEFMRVVKAVLELQGISQIVLLFDEIEFLTPTIANALGSHWDADFQALWQTVRSTSHETGGRLSFIVAGVNSSSVEQPNFEGGANPIFQLAVPYYLEPLSDNSVRDMVRTIGKYSGIAFDEDCYSYLQKTYGGHPYLIRLACSEVVKTKGPVGPEQKVQITLADLLARRAEIKARLNQPIKDILLSLVWWYPDEYEFLRVFAEDQDFANEFIAASPDLAIRFGKYGLLDQATSTFSILDMRDFLIEFGAEYKKAISPFRRGDMPLDVLPTVPNLDDLSALFDKRTAIELALRKLVMMVFGYMSAFDDAAISKRIIAGLGKRAGQDPAQLFIGRRPQDAINELFLSDLKPVYVANWSTFTPYFGINPLRFEMNMDTINIARRVDSHTKPVSEGDKLNFYNSYSWFETILKKIPNIFPGT